jgi:hypothetical protein
MVLFEVTDKAFRMQTTVPLAHIQFEHTLCLQAC